MAPPRTCECGECRKCKHRDYMNDYYRRHAQTIRANAIASRGRRLESVRAYDRERGHRGSTMKDRARKALYDAIARGDLERGCCEVCGEPNAEGHHEDYTKPFDVRWLCRPHHMEIHRTVAA